MSESGSFDLSCFPWVIGGGGGGGGALGVVGGGVGHDADAVVDGGVNIIFFLAADSR
jgi:hypothetical protein